MGWIWQAGKERVVTTREESIMRGVIRKRLDRLETGANDGTTPNGVVGHPHSDERLWKWCEQQRQKHPQGRPGHDVAK